MEAQRDLYKVILARYPDCPPLPDLPPSAVHWSETDFEIFIASMGMIIPSGSSCPRQAPQAKKDDVAFFECAPRNGYPYTECSANSASETAVSGKATADACLSTSSSIYMEDRAPQGLNLCAILAKFDRCRASALQTITGLSTSSLVEEYGVGILLSDIYISVGSAKMPVVTDEVCVNSEIDLPQMPRLPSRQQLIDKDGEILCTAIFGQLFVDLKTKMLSQNAAAYGRVKRPCDATFGRDMPNTQTFAIRQELSAKFAPPHPKQGHPFSPSHYMKGAYAVAPSDCDSYDTLYHPKVTSVCEHACLLAGADFCCKPLTAFFCRFVSTLPPASRLVTHIFFTEGSEGTRALTVFEKDGSCVLCAFAVYGGPSPGKLYQEEVSTASQKSADALISWAQHGTYKAKSGLDLSRLN
mmetsp:Transcript_30782/g.55870  ORF Transcript_30782/g.55870 Transcript_30782/m.55870 type:complete len:412 (-) Transcript_30782:473-1708(-)|eukprot:CAMPEP_0197630108 /NCGR_PEP_ID=MMETSP1338-20131121/7700_1 /TAXON_ID=43686 ORGANISM="Pelagodinium beii, Strain RCC1491" /NCGR_SAMPLE_ID=MMETSP1338 /ASSEMBLY_ACC=CAM_ASM_000754 /LENGTH=411 /DNA_ID=CAMNT_0043201255 /DNA_START=62 /DNA_END=1297 /DNA_ORIENTATION=+